MLISELPLANQHTQPSLYTFDQPHVASRAEIKNLNKYNQYSFWFGTTSPINNYYANQHKNL